MALDATTGGASADSYLTVADADAFAAVTLHTAGWDSATDDDKAAALQQATRQIDLFVAWCGEVATDGQALAWPRRNMPDPLRPGAYIGAGIIPDRLKAAVFNYTRGIIATDTVAPTTAGAAGGAVKKLKAGDVEVEYSEGVTATASRSVPDVVLWMLPAAWICAERQPRAGWRQLPVVRG